MVAAQHGRASARFWRREVGAALPRQRLGAYPDRIVEGVAWRSTVVYYQLINSMLTKARDTCILNSPTGRTYDERAVL